MALADPQSVTIGSAVSLARVLTGEQNATYLSADGTKSLTVSHRITRGRRTTLVRIGSKKISTDVLTDTKSEIEAVMNITFNRPNVGFAEAELIELATGGTTWLSAGTFANTKRVLALES